MVKVIGVKLLRMGEGGGNERIKRRRTAQGGLQALRRKSDG